MFFSSQGIASYSPYYKPRTEGQLYGKPDLNGLLHQQWSKSILNQSYKGFLADEEPSHDHTEEIKDGKLKNQGNGTAMHCPTPTWSN